MDKKTEKQLILEKVHSNPAFKKLASQLDADGLKQIEQAVADFVASFSKALAVTIVASNQK